MGVSTSSSNRGSSVSSSIESIGVSLRLSISLTLGNTVVDQTGSIANSLHSSGNTDSSTMGDSNTSNTRSVSNNVGGVGNVDGGLGADLLGDVLAVLDGGGVNDGGDLVMALLLLVALLLLDHIDHIVALRFLGRGADLLGHRPGDGVALLHWPAAALLLRVGLGVGDSPGVADRLTDGVALLAGDSVVGGLAVRGSDGPLGNSNRSSSNTNGTGVTISSSVDSVAGLGLSQGEGGKESKENHKLLHDKLFFWTSHDG